MPGYNQMTLEITITDTVTVADLLGSVASFAKKILSWLRPLDESADTPDVEDEEDNKSPPVKTASTLADLIKYLSSVLSVGTTDLPNGGSFRP